MLVQCVSTSHQAPPEALATSYLAGIDVGHNRWGRAMREAQRVQDEARVAADLVRKQAVLRLTEEGHGVRTIAAMLGLSKSRVARIVRTGSHIIVAIKNSPDDEYEKPRNVREMVERIWQAAAAVPPRSATE